ncbi:MAG: carbohydrate ABC transporter permease [Spirochaetes bacterium]|nr:MAG: carbohydrate ABC transporter permease [Spirochaetota bacterium]
MYRRRDVERQILLFLGMGAVTALFLFPVLIALGTSLKPMDQLFRYPPKIFSPTISFKSYNILLDYEYRRYFFNGYFIAFCTVGLTLLLGIMGGYSLSRYRLPAKRVIMVGILCLQLFPGAVLMIPIFNMARVLGLYNTYTALIIVDTAFVLPLVLWVLKGYFDMVPYEMEESAMIDGSGVIRIITQIMVPQIKPALIGVGLLAFIRSWNEFLFALILSEGIKVAPVTVGLARLFGQYAIDWNSVMALTIIAVVPLLIAFMVLQRYFIEGLGSGAIKG